MSVDAGLSPAPDQETTMHTTHLPEPVRAHAELRRALARLATAARRHGGLGGFEGSRLWILSGPLGEATEAVAAFQRATDHRARLRVSRPLAELLLAVERLTPADGGGMGTWTRDRLAFIGCALEVRS